MTDDQQQPVAQPSQDDPLSSLEEILAKTKEKRVASNDGQTADGQAVGETSGQQAPDQPTISAEEVNAQRLQELKSMEKVAEQERLEKVSQQKEKMQQMLEGSPEVQARMEQQNNHAREEAERQAREQGHVIHQVTNDKV